VDVKHERVFPGSRGGNRRRDRDGRVLRVLIQTPFFF
jgi:hypothetical protein